MKKRAFLFSGQGSQYAGMGLKLKGHPKGRETFQEANDILGIDIANICCYGTDEELANTEITQPAILTCSIAALRILMSDDQFLQSFRDYELSAAAGLSVGEYSALVACSALSFADALKVVRVRGRLMAESAKANPGTMVAIIGLDKAGVEEICKEANSFGVVRPANYNCPGQVVISGEKKAVDKAVELASKAGARRCVCLDVSGAFHSPLMRPAEPGLRKALKNIALSPPRIPFIANVTGEYVDDPEVIREMLVIQLSNPIQWETSICKMLADGIDSFVEVGPGKVLTGLVRRIQKTAEVFNTDDLFQSVL